MVDTNKQSLNPVHPGRARWLLTSGKAAVFKHFPFTIILKTAIEKPEIHPLRIKIDPGSSVTGIALVNDATGQVVFAAELQHRGHAIKKALDGRRAARRGRRQRKTRYRKPRFANRKRLDGWLPPSLESRITNIVTWVQRLRRVAPITTISQGVVKFDLQQMDKPDISGVQYQQGTLYGYEVREYLLDKWNRQCAYCGVRQVPLQIEHIQAKTHGGTDRISNLCLACEPCNTAKGKQHVRTFLAKKPEVLKRLLAQAKAPLKDASAVNITRWHLCQRLHVKGVSPLLITAKGHGCRRLCNVNEIGFPCSKPKGVKKVKGFQTGDMVRAVVTSGTKQGVYSGRVLIRATGSFDITTKQGRMQGISHRFCTPIHRLDGYSYAKGACYAEHPTQSAR